MYSIEEKGNKFLSDMSYYKRLERVFSEINTRNPKQNAISLLCSITSKEEKRKILYDDQYWLGLLCIATSSIFVSVKMREMSQEEINHLYYVMMLTGENYLESVLKRVRSLYLELRDSSVLMDGVEVEKVSDCFFILLSLYHTKKCLGLCQNEVTLRNCCSSSECRLLLEEIGKHYGVSFIDQ